MNRHHIVPKSRNWNVFSTSDPTNILMMDERVHANIHRLFENKTPQEQFRLLLSINKQVINPQTTKDLYEILSEDVDEFYTQEVLRFQL